MNLTVSHRDPAAPGLDDGIEVLYLEDDPDLAEMYELKLQTDGYHVRTVPLAGGPPLPASGPAPELLFVDIRSETGGSANVFARWRADSRFRDIPAVILSDVNRQGLEERGIRLGNLDQIVRTPAPEPPH